MTTHDHLQQPLNETLTQHDRHIMEYLQTEASHGLTHATETANLTFHIAQEPEYSGHITTDELKMLRHAGFLHDIGYKDARPYWSGTQEEHPTESALNALNILKDMAFYREKPERLGQVLWLIYNHDNTNYTFPAFWLFEQPFLGRSAPHIAVPRSLPGTTRSLPPIFEKVLGENYVPNVRTLDNHLIDLLQVLQEADSRLGDAERTLAFCDTRSVPRFSNEGGVKGIGPLWWQGSAAANIILALNRALLDAHTRSGQTVARKIYGEGFAFVRELYDEQLENPSFCKPESGVQTIAQLRPDDLSLIFNRSRRVRWANGLTDTTYIAFAQDLHGTLYELQERFRKKYSLIATRIVPLEDIQSNDNNRPQAIERDGLSALRSVREDIIKSYAFDPFTQIGGSLRVNVHEHDPVLHDEIHPYHLIQPTVLLNHLSNIGHPPYTLLFGEEWVKDAREVGLGQVRVIFVQE